VHACRSFCRAFGASTWAGSVLRSRLNKQGEGNRGPRAARAAATPEGSGRPASKPGQRGNRLRFRLGLQARPSAFRLGLQASGSAFRLQARPSGFRPSAFRLQARPSGFRLGLQASGSAFRLQARPSGFGLQARPSGFRLGLQASGFRLGLQASGLRPSGFRLGLQASAPLQARPTSMVWLLVLHLAPRQAPAPDWSGVRRRLQTAVASSPGSASGTAAVRLCRALEPNIPKTRKASGTPMGFL
jgi:hypothetical protein